MDSIGTPRLCAAVPFASAFVSDRYTNPSSHTTAADPEHPPLLAAAAPPLEDPVVSGDGLGGCMGGGDGGSATVDAGVSAPSGPRMMASVSPVVVVGVDGVEGGAVGDGLKLPVPSGMGSGGRV
jgi:hypothetical protein